MVDLERALGYPYKRPDCSYLFHCQSGTTTLFSDLEPTATSIPSFDQLTRNRCCVLAIGSNAAPEQLRRKFNSFTPQKQPPSSDHTDDAFCIPVLSCAISNYDVVYAGLLTSYGSVPATIHPSPGIRSRIFATFLTDDQLEYMHKTEGSYLFAKILNSHISFHDYQHLNEAQTVRPLGGVFCYVARQGALRPKNVTHNYFLALSEVSAENRINQPISQIEAMNVAQEICNEQVKSTVDFIIETVTDFELRKKRTGLLESNSTPFQFGDNAELVQSLSRVHT